MALHKTPITGRPLRELQEDGLLEAFGVNPIWESAKLHMLLCLVLGALCTFIDTGIRARKVMCRASVFYCS